MNDTLKLFGKVQCDECGASHEAAYTHMGHFGEGPIYAVVCPADGCTGFYTMEKVELT